MDLFSRNRSFNHVPPPVDPVGWENYILNQQGSVCAHRSHTIRRFTVDGVPTFEDFREHWDERHGRSFASEHSSPPIRQRPVSRSSSREPCVFDISDLDDDLPGTSPSMKPSSKASSYNSQRQQLHHGFPSQHTLPSHHGLPRGTSFNSTRYSPYNSPKRSRRFTAGDHLPASTSASSFEDAVRRDKARFCSQQKAQHHHRRSKPRTSTMPKREQFGDIPPQPAPKPQPAPDLRTATNLYHQWHEECEQAFQDKSTMTSFPHPPTPACSKCQQIAMIGREAIPLACLHSLEALFRGATKGPGSNPADSTAYFKILKKERNRWHTDRFGTCKEGVKAEIEKQARVLFVHINELYGKEKSRLDRVQASRSGQRKDSSID